ncbi:hypothetical protein GMORB2_4873 [Geosmithia morbida]|uniref:Uncharacterized protein n=1 Tax=Geosmithia morbida TaxID=1094350 RepID=A0A9P4YQU4_9HYPO|nr:uncharacterized protein GMORB2_4873 [Geosmithia morbida]KAF4119354.1 hypothetical protein GMORB2_4873 [Geosmithia morbida]
MSHAPAVSSPQDHRYASMAATTSLYPGTYRAILRMNKHFASQVKYVIVETYNLGVLHHARFNSNILEEPLPSYLNSVFPGLRGLLALNVPHLCLRGLIIAVAPDAGYLRSPFLYALIDRAIMANLDPKCYTRPNLTDYRNLRDNNSWTIDSAQAHPDRVVLDIMRRRSFLSKLRRHIDVIFVDAGRLHFMASVRSNEIVQWVSELPADQLLLDEDLFRRMFSIDVVQDLLSDLSLELRAAFVDAIRYKFQEVYLRSSTSQITHVD